MSSKARWMRSMGLLKTFRRLSANLKIHFGCLGARQHLHFIHSAWNSCWLKHFAFLVSLPLSQIETTVITFQHIATVYKTKPPARPFPNENSLFANTNWVLAPIQNDAMQLCFYFHLWQIWSSPFSPSLRDLRVWVYAVVLVCQRILKLGDKNSRLKLVFGRCQSDAVKIAIWNSACEGKIVFDLSQFFNFQWNFPHSISQFHSEFIERSRENA